MSLFNQIAEKHYSAPPQGWQTRKIKFLADIQTSNVDKLSADDEESVRLCNYTDVYYNDRITPDMAFMEATATAKEIEKFTLKAGQVFITKDSEGWDDIGIPALVTDDMPGVLCGYHLAIFTPDSDKLDGAFLAWLCRADAPNDQFKLSANGVTRFGLGQYPMKNAVVGYPPLETQRRIAAFLDEKTAQIDGLIARKQALLARLAEKRQAIITQAVTKGLNPAAPLKDSGIDWLGQIPAHWGLKPLKRVVSIWGRIGFRGYTVNDIVSESEGALSLSPSNIVGDQINFEAKTYISWDKYHESPEIKVRAGDILFVKTGSTIGKVCHVAERREPMTVNPQVVVLKVHRAHSLFLSAAMSSVYFQHQVKGCIFGGSTPAMTQYNLGSLAVVTPPMEEQRSISDWLSEADDEYSTAKRNVERSISLLTEYRSALITAAVTGQIEGLR